MLHKDVMGTVRFAGAALLVGALLLVLVGRPAPIVIWDEGRIILNAMEMRHSGLSPIATYDFHPDLWNTKPPLLVWLMTASMALLGPAEWTARLPSTIASLGTLLLVMTFLHGLTRSLATAVLGAVILATSVAFFGEHGAGTGDYDALLCFFTTAYLQLLFFAVHRRCPPARWLLLAGGLGAAALMTKGIAGAIPAAGFAIYLAVTGRWRRLRQTPHYRTAAIAAIAPLLLFCAIREATAPGYMAAMLYNDVSGRFGEALDGHGGPPWYYLDVTFFAGLFSVGLFALAAPVALAVARGRTRQGLIFALCIALGQLIVVSMSATKLSHYFLSAYPFVAIAVALAIHAALRALAARRSADATRSPLAEITMKLIVAVIVIRGAALAIHARQAVLPEREYYSQARYGELLAALADRSEPIILFDQGLPIPDDPHYAPQLRFYAMAARERGRQVEQSADIGRIATAPADAIFASCDPAMVPALRARGETLAAIPGCVAVR